MKRLNILLLPLLALMTSSVIADSRVLSDDQMDQITAGTAGDRQHPTAAATGGVIVSGEAQASVSGDNNISLQDNAQLGARALSMTNTADAAVANGVNLWDGAVQDLGIGNGINVLQSNDLLQGETSPYAWLLGYERGHGTLRDVSTFADSTAPVQTIKFGLQLDVNDVGSFDGRGEVPAAVIPGAKIPGSFGNVVGFAGDLGVDFDGGSFSTGFNLASSLAAEAHLGAEAESSILWGLISLGKGELDSRTRIEGSFNPYITIGMELPDLTLSGEGAVCYANAGECRSSVLDRDIAELDLGPIGAEYIVVDRSALNADKQFSVTLGNEAQADARAVMLTNAAGGLVANAINMATTSDTGFLPNTDQTGFGLRLSADLLDLTQDNVTNQERGGAVTDDRDRGRHEHPAEAGGILVANESNATISANRTVNVTNSSQAGARALSLVNSADALVATGVNIFDGRLQESDFADRNDVQQSNLLTQQDGQAAAGIDGYRRGPESLHHVTTDAKSAATPKSLGTRFSLNILGSDSQDAVASLTGNLEIPASVIPTSKIPGLGGTAAAFAGDVDMHLDGGTANFGFGIEESGLHFSTVNSAKGSNGDTFGLFDLKGDADYESNSSATVDASLNLAIDMPDLDVEVDGAACFVQKGTCAAGVTDREIARLRVSKAGAEYIVLDRSMLHAGTMNAITLENGAQAGARAMSLVNAAGGSVASGINIGSWRAEESTLALPLLNLAQENDVTQMSGSTGWRSASGGAIVADESMASLFDWASVSLMNEAQAGAQALSIVNSADASVANGINLWTGDFASATFDKSINVLQTNMLVQQGSESVAKLGHYHRHAEWLRDVRTFVTTKPEPSPEDGFFPPADPRHISGAVELEIGDLVNYERTGWVPTSIIPTSKIPGGKPGALGFAGDAFLHYDGGGVELTTSTGNHFSSTTDAIASGRVTGFFGLASGRGETSWHEHSHVGVTSDLTVSVDMPDLTIDVEGAGCIAKGADCSAGIVEKESGPLHVSGASAEYIAVDGANLTAVEGYGVTLGASAQADARALSIVNASGGDVANGLNVARVTANQLAAQPNMAQSNLVLQGGPAFTYATSKMDRKSATGGAIVAADSMAVLGYMADVSLTDAAQENVRALLLVNSADAMVGNGINLSVNDLAEADVGHAINLAQTNQVMQNAAPATARLRGYHRHGGELRDVYTIADSRATQQYIKAAFEIDLLDLARYYEGLIVPASAIPNSKIPGARGMVAGFAGEADVTYGGGTADLQFGIDGHLWYDNLLKTDVAAGDLLGFGKVKGKTEFGIDEFSINFAPTFFFHADFPTLNIDAEGALCWANGGTCSAGILEEDSGDLSIHSANAEHVVIDHAVLEATESYRIALDNGAQANARAMAIVNAAGGLVGNGVNVSTMRGSALATDSINVVQRNVIVQGR